MWGGGFGSVRRVREENGPQGWHQESTRAGEREKLSEINEDDKRRRKKVLNITAIKEYSGGRNEEKAATQKRASYMDRHRCGTARNRQPKTRDHATTDNMLCSKVPSGAHRPNQSLQRL